MSSIFLSYRRADSQGWAGRLGADLAQAFGDVARFFDLESIEPGADFLREIDSSLAKADVVLALIGPRWLDLRNAHGQRRLDDPADVVAAEIARALESGVLVIPVLLGAAPMPVAEDLPLRLRQISRRNGVELRDSRWKSDLDPLFAAIEAATGLSRPMDQAAATAVSVGSNLDLRDAEVGRVTGARGAVPSGGVDVLGRARLQNVKIGDITGVEIVPPTAPRP